MLIKQNFESRDVGKYCKLMMGERMGKEGIKKEKKLVPFIKKKVPSKQK